MIWQTLVLVVAGHLAAAESWMIGGSPVLPEVGPGQPRAIALTFDDGPVPGASEVLLAALRDQGWQATFCLLGSRADEHPALVRRMVEEGHQIVNHSWSHANPTGMADADLLADVRRSSEALGRIAGQAVTIYRPPYLALRPEQAALLHRELGVTILTETWNSGDWKRPPPGAVRERMLSGIPNGSIVLAHESFPQSVAEMPGIIAALAAAGYRSVTVSQLVALASPGVK